MHSGGVCLRYESWERERKLLQKTSQAPGREFSDAITKIIHPPSIPAPEEKGKYQILRVSAEIIIMIFVFIA
jgi:hypothetical protein